MEELFQLLNSIYPLSDGLKEHLPQILQRRELKKKEILLKAGHICRNIYFIEKGLLRCFYIEGNKEINSWFMKEGDVIASVPSFFDQKESYETIQALEASVVYYISFQQLRHIYKTYLEFNYVGRELVQNYYKLSEQRLFEIRMRTAAERLELFKQHHPDLYKRVDKKDLASYLGFNDRYASMITPEMEKRKSLNAHPKKNGNSEKEKSVNNKKNI